MSIKVVTYNVNHSRRAQGEFVAFSWENRKCQVVDVLCRLRPTIILLQEIPCEEVAWFTSYFPKFHWISVNESSRGGNFTAMAIGVHSDLSSGGIIKLDDSPPDCLSVLWPESKTVIVNVHLPMEKDARQAATLELKKFKTNHEAAAWIVGGDFNSFPDADGFNFMLSLNAALGTHSATEFARSATDCSKLATKTFKPYPYDIVDACALEMDGKLDHILFSGLTARSALVFDNLTYEHNLQYWPPSDHYPVLVYARKV